MLHFTLNSRACIAAAAMVDLELHSGAGPVSLTPLAERLDVSLSYLQQIIAALRRHGLLNSVRGPGGGYQLARAACDISVADIVTAVDEDAEARSGDTKSYGNWPCLSQRMAEALASVSLQELADEQPRPVVHEPKTDAAPALRRGISTRPVLKPVAVPAFANSIFALTEALK
ncbi:Rrf2 family transcriptional regulator [Pelomonas cellulosilytica]|uniref:Rrf2 family transcriptional regulator n=1 Tax=Pelomonas cellulosilytica TaxID=2906762 RepID=A0ABS8XXV0_9BURK|nr:Rrf2 family transcriptional regulator [Pelomonas sp. P8]MCE4556763.1 Rrf2 family transcriptional regulator [Pelomonas sp. P8]